MLVVKASRAMLETGTDRKRQTGNADLKFYKADTRKCSPWHHQSKCHSCTAVERLWLGQGLVHTCRGEHLLKGSRGTVESESSGCWSVRSTQNAAVSRLQRPLSPQWHRQCDCLWVSWQAAGPPVGWKADSTGIQ